MDTRTHNESWFRLLTVDRAFKTGSVALELELEFAAEFREFADFQK